ncbi:hypothetical protein ACFQJ8_14355 [Halocatena marina]|uniref:family 4 glycosyl hydrolase n=1 Tax=Halocatena marina TaxID=2934937 RepID=UPI00360B523B
MLEALAGGDSFATNVNMVNTGQVSDIEAGAVVETNALVRANEIRPLSTGGFPRQVRSMITTHVDTIETIIEASRTGDVDEAFKGFLIDPQIRTLSPEDSRNMFAELISAETSYLDDWKLTSPRCSRNRRRTSRRLTISVSVATLVRRTKQTLSSFLFGRPNGFKSVPMLTTVPSERYPGPSDDAQLNSECELRCRLFRRFLRLRRQPQVCDIDEVVLRVGVRFTAREETVSEVIELLFDLTVTLIRFLPVTVRERRNVRFDVSNAHGPSFTTETNKSPRSSFSPLFDQTVTCRSKRVAYRIPNSRHSDSP